MYLNEIPPLHLAFQELFKEENVEYTVHAILVSLVARLICQ
jgi:hypothetical protein